MTRRDCLKRCGAVGLAALAGTMTGSAGAGSDQPGAGAATATKAAGKMAAPVPRRPNVLYIMSDDHTAQAIGAYGGRLAKLNPTPTIDRLAREGMLFANVLQFKGHSTDVITDLALAWLKEKRHAGKPVKGHGGNRYHVNTPVAWEFYDLAEDPCEMHNRYGQAKYRDTVDDLKRQLKKLREDLDETDANYPRIARIIEEHWAD